MIRNSIIVALYLLITSCGQAVKQEKNVSDSSSNTKINNQVDFPVNDRQTNLDMNNIEVQDVSVGDFPFFALPEGLVETNSPLLREFDICFFPINGIMTPFEGKLYKTFVSPAKGKDFSQHYFQKSIAKYLDSISATKIFDGEITRDEYNKYHKLDPNKGDEGDMGYAGQNIKVWVLRTVEQGNILFQYQSNNAGASINVLQVISD